MILKLTKTHYKTISDAWCKARWEKFSHNEKPIYWTGSRLGSIEDAVNGTTNPSTHNDCLMGAMLKAAHHYSNQGYKVEII